MHVYAYCQNEIVLILNVSSEKSQCDDQREKQQNIEGQAIINSTQLN